MYTPGSITKWSRVAGGLALVAIIVPDGAYRWAALSLAGAALVVAATRVPRQAWATHKVMLATLGCAVAAFLAAELLPLSAGVTAWLLGVTGGVFLAMVLISAVRLFRRGDKRS